MAICSSSAPGASIVLDSWNGAGQEQFLRVGLMTRRLVQRAGAGLTNRKSRGPCKTEALIETGFTLKAGRCVGANSPVAAGAMASNCDAGSVG